MRYGEVDFSALAERYDRWWNNKLGRPIIPLILWGADPGRPRPSAPGLGFTSAYDERYSPEEILDRVDYDLSCHEYYGDAYPIINMSAFGPGVAAAFLGAEVHVADYTVWFDCPEKLPIRELHFEYNTDNKYYRRLREFYVIFAQKYASRAVMTMTDLGGVLDILSSFRGAENLLCDLVDEPEEVLRCVGEIQTAWFKYFDDFTSIIAPYAKGYSHWDAIYNTKPNYMLQSDFSYMIGPEMFSQFVMPELETSAARLDKPFYHLDGIGELPHLDMLLASEHIKGIQWVPGSGTPELSDWTEVYRRIGAAGKKLHNIQANLDNVNWAVSMLPAPDTLYMGLQYYPLERKQEAFEKMRAAGCEDLT
jgi:hypothetical protein